jgi:hypothetical protein
MQLRPRVRGVDCRGQGRWCGFDIRRAGATICLRSDIMSAARGLVQLIPGQGAKAVCGYPDLLGRIPFDGGQCAPLQELSCNLTRSAVMCLARLHRVGGGQRKFNPRSWISCG